MSKGNEIIEKAKNAVLAYDSEAAEEAAQEALKANISPVDVIQLGFTKGMTEVGDKYAAKELYLPHVIAASEAMTAGVKVLTPALEKMGGSQSKGLGTVVICTIEGDIHCIGKDIVAIMMKVAGFNVVNLGRDIPVKDIVAAGVGEVVAHQVGHLTVDLDTLGAAHVPGHVRGAQLVEP